MKILMKPIEMIAWFNKDAYPVPLRYRVTAEDMSYTVIKVDKILFREEEKLAGNRMILYRCEGIINNNKYNISNILKFLIDEKYVLSVLK